MNEAQRLAYLDAIGLVSYVPRLDLPGAMPSLLYSELHGQLPEELREEVQPAVHSPSKDKLAPVVTVPQEGKAGGKQSFTQLQSSLVSEKPVTPVSFAQIKNTPAPKDPAQINVRFHLTILQPAPEVLVFLPVAHHDNNNMLLLKNILLAIGINDSAMKPVENFIWPPALASSPNATPISSSLNDARETVQALLEGYQVKQQRLQQVLQNVLVFEENLGKALFDGLTVPGLQLLILPSLQIMSTSSPEKIAEAKKITWQKLKALKKI